MTQDVYNILSAITEAKNALEREPQLQSRITELERSLNQSQSHAQELETRIIGYKSNIDHLNEKVRSLEVERDDMGFRELEASDKLDALRMVVKSFMANAESHMPKPVEVKKDLVDAGPLHVFTPETGGAATGSYSNPSPEPTQPPHPIEATGQSESPLSSSATTTQVSETTAGATSTATHSESAPSPKPYEGKTHTEVFGDHKYHVSFSEWLAGGGSENGWQN